MESPGLAAVGAELVSEVPKPLEFVSQLLRLLLREMDRDGVFVGCGEADQKIGDADARDLFAVEMNVGLCV